MTKMRPVLYQNSNPLFSFAIPARDVVDVRRTRRPVASRRVVRIPAGRYRHPQLGEAKALQYSTAAGIIAAAVTLFCLTRTTR